MPIRIAFALRSHCANGVCRDRARHRSWQHSIISHRLSRLRASASGGLRQPMRSSNVGQCWVKMSEGEQAGGCDGGQQRTLLRTPAMTPGLTPSLSSSESWPLRCRGLSFGKAPHDAGHSPIGSFSARAAPGISRRSTGLFSVARIVGTLALPKYARRLMVTNDAGRRSALSDCPAQNRQRSNPSRTRC